MAIYHPRGGAIIRAFVDGINAYCTDRRERVHLNVPTGDEILEVVLCEVGITPIQDEKRAAYRPVIEKFGGLQKSAAAFSGQRARILQELGKEPLTRGDLLGRARLGNGRLNELADPASNDTFVSRLDPIAQRVFRNRRRARHKSGNDVCRTDGSRDSARFMELRRSVSGLRKPVNRRDAETQRKKMNLDFLSVSATLR